MKKVILKLEAHDEKSKQKAMKTVANISGVESVSMEMKDKKLTVIGDVDPVEIVRKLRKLCWTELMSVGPAKEPEKKKEEPRKEEPKKANEKKDPVADTGGLILISPLIQEALSNANSIADGKIKLAPNLMEKVAELKTYLTAVQAVVGDAEKTQESDLAISTWLQMLSDAVYDAVDMLDEIIYFRLQKMQGQGHESSSYPLDGGSRRMKGVEIQGQKPQKQAHASYEYGHKKEVKIQSQKLQEQVHTFSPSNFTVDFDGGENFLDIFAALNESLAKITKEVDFIDGAILFRKKNLVTTTGYGIPPIVDDDSQVIGKENDVRKILQSLENLRSQHQISGISIVGMAGIGKTTVARLIENKASEEGLYDEVAWVSVSEDFNHQRILSEMSQYCENFCEFHADGKGTVDELIQFLGEELKMKTFLLILDDLWDLDPYSLNVFAGHLSIVIELTEGRCSIVLTTQSKRVASMTVEEKLFSMHKLDMGLLSDGECWSIIKEVVLRSSFETSIQSDLEDDGKEIAKRCGGLPLAAVIIGGALSCQIEIEKWRVIRDNTSWLLDSRDGNKMLSVLKTTSFDRLSSPLKKCFCYCSLFARGSTIERDDLVQLWMAQGFLHQPNGSSMTLEDVGNQYLSDLLSYCFFQNEVRDSCGNIISCEIHDIMHDLALFVSKSETLIWEATCSFNGNTSIRHLRAEQFDPSILGEAVQRVRSLFLEDYHIGFRPPELRSLRCLKVKRFARSIFDSHYVGNMKFLKYLSISNSLFVMSVSLSMLCNLETLKLRNCSGVATLQIGLRIKNLNISECFSLTSIQSFGELASLQSFRLSSCYELKNLPIGLGSCISLKNLSIDHCSKLTSIPRMDGLSSLESLELSDFVYLSTLTAGSGSFISLKSLRISNCSFLTSLKSVEGVSSLESLKLEDCERLTSLTAGPASLVSLKNLTITGCPLLISIPSIQWSSLESLELRNHNGLTSLPTSLGSCISLKNLRISYGLVSVPSIHGLSNCVSLESLGLEGCDEFERLSELGSFISLQKLIIRNCPRIQHIPKDMNKFPSLVYLEIAECRKLSSIPEEWLGNLNSLTELTLGPFWPGLEEFPGLASIHHLQDSLKVLKIVGWPKLDILPPQLAQLTALEELVIRRFDGVEVLPEWLGNLSSLRRLIIESCYKLMHLPSVEAIRCLSQLEDLIIFNCPELEARCASKSESEWDKISHIKFIYIKSNQEQHSKSSLKLSSAKSATGIANVFPKGEEELCPICLEEYTPENPKIMTKCSHQYHFGCIYEWMESSEHCPICGKVIVFLLKDLSSGTGGGRELETEIIEPEFSQYDFETIQEATNNFSIKNVLGKGGFGLVYKGTFENGQEVAIKRLYESSGQGDRDFRTEVEMLSKLQHRNVVRLIGFCSKGDERLLIYEFVPNASLDRFIFDSTKRSELQWENLYNIIVGVAQGLRYLHELQIVHLNIKSSNILLDDDMQPKIADFGLARLLPEDQSHFIVSEISGTLGYMAPEYIFSMKCSVRADVFSFGVLLLEIVIGQKNASIRDEESMEGIINHTWKHWRAKTTLNLIDPTLRSNESSIINQILRCIHIGLLCVRDEAARPTMKEVVEMLYSGTPRIFQNPK